MTTDPIATRRTLAAAIKPRLVIAGHIDGPVTVDPVLWATTMSALRTANARVRELELERTQTGEGR